LWRFELLRIIFFIFGLGVSGVFFVSHLKPKVRSEAGSGGFFGGMAIF